MKYETLKLSLKSNQTDDTVNFQAEVIVNKRTEFYDMLRYVEISMIRQGVTNRARPLRR